MITLLRKNIDINKVFMFFFIAYTISFTVEKLVSLRTSLGVIFLPEILFIPMAITFLFQLPNIWQNRQSVFSEWLKIDSLILAYGLIVLTAYFQHPTNNSLRELIGCGYMTSFYFVINFAFRHQKLNIWFKSGLTLFALLGILASFISIGSYILGVIGMDKNLSQTNGGYPLIGDTLRAYGFFRNPIFHANYLICTFIVFASYYFVEIKRLILRFGILLLLFFLAIFLTKTKSFLLFFAVVTYFVTQLWEIKKLLRYTIYFIAILSIFAYVFLSHFLIVDMTQPHLTEKLSSDYYFPEYIWSFTDHYALVPTFYYGTKRAALLACYDFFPFGVGGDNLGIYVNQLVAQGRHFQAFCCAPHSTFFGALGELGVIGFGIVVALFIKMWRMATTITLSDSVAPHLNLMLKAIIFFLAVEAITVDLMNIRHFWLIISFLALLFREHVAQKHNTVEVSKVNEKN